MKRTDEENMKRKDIFFKAIGDAVACLAAGGYRLTPEQAQIFQSRIELDMARLHRDEPTGALHLLMAASVILRAGEVLSILPPADPAAWTLELVTITLGDPPSRQNLN